MYSKPTLKGKESDLFASYDNALFGSNYFTGNICFFNQTTNPVNDTNAIGQPYLTTANNIGLLMGKPRTDSDPNSGFHTTSLNVSDYPIGTVRYFHQWHPYNANGLLKFTTTANPVKSGSGNTERIWLVGNLVETGDVSPSDGDGDYFKISEEIPSQLKALIPPSWIIGDPFVKKIGVGTGDTEILQTSLVPVRNPNGIYEDKSIAHLNDHIHPVLTAPRTLSAIYETNSSQVTAKSGKIRISQGVTPGTYQITWGIKDNESLVGGGSIPKSDIEDILTLHHKFTMFTGTKVLKGRISGYGGGGNSYPYQLNLINSSKAGADFLDNENISIRLESALVDRDEFMNIALLANAPGANKWLAMNSGNDAVLGLDAPDSLPNQSGQGGKQLFTDGTNAYWKLSSISNVFDSGNLTVSGTETVTDTEAITGPSINETGIVTTEDIAGFGRVYKTIAALSVRFVLTYNATLGVAFRVRYSDTKPTSSSDAKNFGTQLIQFNPNTQGDETAYNTTANRYWWISLSGGGSRVVNKKDTRIVLSYESSVAGDITGVTAGSGLTGGGLHGNVSLAVNPGDGIEIDSNKVKAKLDGTTLSLSSSGLKVANDGITNTQLADASVAVEQLDNNSDAKKAAFRTAIAADAVTTAGNGLSRTGNSYSIDLDGSSLSLSSSGVKVNDSFTIDWANVNNKPNLNASDVSVKTSSYTLVKADEGSTIFFNGSSLTATLPDITGTIEAGYYVYLKNINSSNLTVTANGNDTIAGSTNDYTLKQDQTIRLQARTTSAWEITTTSGEEQVQADLAETDTGDPSFVKGKDTFTIPYSRVTGSPTIPTPRAAGLGLELTGNELAVKLDGNTLQVGSNGLKATGIQSYTQHDITFNSATTTWNTSGNVWGRLLLTGNIGKFDVSNMAEGTAYLVEFVQDATGGHTINSWGTKFPANFSPVIGDAPGAATLIGLFYSNGRILATSVASGSSGTITGLINPFEALSLPLAAGVAVTAKDFSNVDSTIIGGLWSDGTTLYVGDLVADKLLAYNLETKNRTSNKDISITGNIEAGYIWGNNTTIWCYTNGKTLQAYDIATRSRDSSKDITLTTSLSNGYFENGIWSNGTTIWIPKKKILSGSVIEKLYAFNFSGVRDSSKDITLPDNTVIRGIWSDGTTMWAYNTINNTFYAYTLSDGSRDTSKDVGLFVSNSEDIWSDGITIWITQRTNRSIKAFNINKDLIWDAGSKPNATVAMTKNIPGLKIKNTQDGGIYMCVFEQDSTGSRTQAFPSDWKWMRGVPGALSTTANRSDFLVLMNVDNEHYAILTKDWG